MMRSEAQLTKEASSELKVKASIVTNALQKPFSTTCGTQNKTALRPIDLQEV